MSALIQVNAALAESNSAVASIVTTREFATVLAALRLHQAINTGVGPVEALATVNEIATDGGEHAALDEIELDALCERINCAQ